MKYKKNLAYQPEEYWKKKIGFDIEKEFRIYQYLCGKLQSTRKIKRIDEDKRYQEYKSWRKHVEEILHKCDNEILREFYHFLKLKDIECDIDMGMHNSMIIPLFIALLVGVLLQWMLSLGNTMSAQLEFNPILQVMLKGRVEFILACMAVAVLLVIFVLIIAISVGVVMIPLWVVFKRYMRSKYMTAFWRDYLEIAKEVMDEKGISEK